MSTLLTTDLTKSYGGRTVVRGVSLEVASGEVVGLLGPNGAGKTTTFYMTVGLTAPDAGRVTLDGDTALDGRIPINPSGGLKARGHPLAATGIAQIVECVWQLTGGAPGRQLSGRVALAHSIGGLATNNWVTLLEARSGRA